MIHINEVGMIKAGQVGYVLSVMGKWVATMDDYERWYIGTMQERDYVTGATRYVPCLWNDLVNATLFESPMQILSMIDELKAGLKEQYEDRVEILWDKEVNAIPIIIAKEFDLTMGGEMPV